MSWDTNDSYERPSADEFEKAYPEDIVTGRDVELSRERRGDLSENMVEQEFLKQDVTVLRTVTDNEPYDLVVECNSEFLKVQVKTGKLDMEVGTVTAKAHRTHTNSDGTVGQTYSDDEVDVFAICCPEIDRVFLVPDERVDGKRLELRVLAPKTEQPSINWARDYEFEKVWGDRYTPSE